MTKILFAPMAGVGDSAFRTICMRHGADGVTSEMISAKATVFGDKKTLLLAKRTDEETPFALQIFGSEPDIMAKGAKILVDATSPDSIDINMGCPVNKIVKNGEGSALMKNPSLVYEIVSRVVEAVSPLPVTVKIRRGIDESHINAVEVALMAEKGGASMITVHGRTRDQFYAPPVDLETIKAVKEAVKCPVVGNGDIVSGESAKRMLEVTGCDHIMIGRGAIGRPWIFNEIKSTLFGAPMPHIPVGEELKEAIMTHLDLAIALKNERQAIMESRAQIAWYVKGIKGAAAIRQKINSALTRDAVAEILKEL
ncbi:MAG: tRNA dihydrouridine synthase DusB [Ruminococcaceae bacterium]|nr:tRNA dihydrouridine synthase DusB [Oscillospiraceae bacterium]